MNRATVYRVSDTKTGLYVVKSPRHGGFRWGKKGSIWKNIGHIKNSLNQGILKRVVRDGHHLIVTSYEVEETMGRVYNIKELP
jgi:hypothetical protein